MKNSVKSMILFNGDVTYYLPSILFNNRFDISPIYYMLIPSMLFYYVSQKNPSMYFPFFAFSWFAILILFFLLTPRKLMLRENEIQHYSLWKEKWTNLKNFNLKNGVLTLETLDGKTRIVKKIHSDIAEEIVEFINQKVNGTV